MDEFLLFQLYGPMASWGDVAVGEYRPSAAQPSKSAVLGLMAAAMGVRRDEEERHRAMADGYGLTVAVLATGTLLRDYHTVQVPPQQRGTVWRTRRDELRSNRLGTILTSRDYRTDALYRIAVRRRSEVAPFTLEALRDGLLRPHFTLYLGRKSCPPSLPLQPQINSATDVTEALEQASFADLRKLVGIHALPDQAARPALYWDAGEPVARRPLKTFTRRDVPSSRRRWQFAERPEHWSPGDREE